jgi:ATP-dependent DNA ligase
MTQSKMKATFIEPMLLLRKENLPEDREWLYEIKMDGYRAIAFKSGGTLQLRSRNDNDFGLRYRSVVKGLASLPNETVIDGEVVALDESGKLSFNILQNYGSSEALVFYYVFDVLVLKGRDVMGETLEARRALLEKSVLPRLADPICYSPELRESLPKLDSFRKSTGP